MKIVVYPHADKNPYQQLLYGAMEDNHNVQVDYLETERSIFILLPVILLYKYLKGYRVFHLHWPSFYVAKSYPRAALISFMLSKYCLYAIRFSGLRLVWTVHNALPHEAETTNDLNINKYLAKHAAAKIIHSNFALQELKTLGLNASRMHVIQHGNYTGVYPDGISAPEARKKLDIKPGEFVFLFFGLVRSYKGIDHLLKAYRETKLPNTRLLIVGKCDDPVLTDQIKQAAETANIGFFPGFVDDSDVSMYFKASDVVCLPFNAVTTSGSALLALTFAKPLIAPRAGSLVDLPDNVGLFYSLKDSDGLSNSLQRAVQDKAGQISRVQAARSYAETLSWGEIADQTYKVYQSVLAHGAA